MKIKENIKVRKIGNEKILIVNDGRRADYTRVVSLNDSAAFLVEKTGGEDFSAQKWAGMLVEEYAVSLEKALKDVEALIATMNEAGILE